MRGGPRVCARAEVRVWACGCRFVARTPPPYVGAGDAPPQGGGHRRRWDWVRDYYLVFIYILEVCISCVCACACGWYHFCSLRVARGGVLCRGVWAFPSRWEGAKGIVCRAALRLKCGLHVVAVGAHPQVSCAVRGAEGQARAVARAGRAWFVFFRGAGAQVYDVSRRG